MLASTTVRSSKGRAAKVMRKKSKQLKDMELTLALLTPDNPAVREEKSYGNFYIVKWHWWQKLKVQPISLKPKL
jgi:hypothetical protein